MQRTILAVSLLAFLVASPVFADRRSEALASHATIDNGGDDHRLLFKANGLRSLESVAIRHARIEFDLAGATTDRTLYLSLCPVTTSWEAGSVQWESGWTRPGGDFDEDLASEVAVDLSRGGKASFDVTPILKEWLEHGVEYDGFLLTVQPREGGEGIRGEDVTRLQGLANASLVVDYRRVPPPPPMARRGG
ncbi:MAG: hypothetical protein K8E66_08740 [Phycisphaerales bacterium]|nr:hypothetical protein [Phycisphaerales bacterium]